MEQRIVENVDIGATGEVGIHGHYRRVCCGLRSIGRNGGDNLLWVGDRIALNLGK
jgi:hypothetical protein